MTKPEILAPAGNFESLKVAIANGADAIYLGIDEFNARGNIQNFTLENLGEVIDYSHLFGVKIYLALNILLKDDEFARAEEIIEKTSQIGVDAFIIQDIGLYYFIKNLFPNIEIHASTQMGIENLSGAKFIKDLGFKRIVLARETSLDDIENISKNLNVDLEYFVQGALCVSFSGNCYLCSLLAGASGNRGKCKQFCRLPYTLEKGDLVKKGYLLSTKDFCMVPYLKKLYNSGVTSFKIEGRARRPGYVGQTVKTYRKVVDNNFQYSEDDINNLKKVYNRGDFIAGYFENEKVIYSKAQNHIGVIIGHIESVKNGKKFNEIRVFSTHPLKKDDVVKFFVNDEEIGVLGVNDVKEISKNHYVLTTTNTLPAKAEMTLIVDSSLEDEILHAKRILSVKAYLNASVGQKAKLKLECNGIEIEVESEEKLSEAKTSPLQYDECFKQLSKLGDEFVLTKLETKMDNIFMAKSQLNRLRRDGIELLKSKLIENYKKRNNLTKKAIKIDKKIEFFNKISKKSNIIAFSDFEKLNKSHLKKDILIYKIDNFLSNNLAFYYDKYKDYNIYISLPIIASENEVKCVKKILEMCSNWGIVANNYYALELCSKEKTIIGEGLNVFNSYAVKFYADQGYTKIILSNELDDQQNIDNCRADLFYYQKFYPEYMNFKHCPVKENVGGDCAHCKFGSNFVYKLNNNKFNLVRKRILNCQFVLKDSKLKNRVLNKNLSSIEEVW